MVQAVRPRSTAARLRKRPRGGRNKRTTNFVLNAPPVPNPVLITDVTVSSPSLTLTFDQVVSVSGLPGFGVDVGSGTVTQATQPAPNQVELVFSEAITGATTVTVGVRDPAIRGINGGYVTATAHVFA